MAPAPAPAPAPAAPLTGEIKPKGSGAIAAIGEEPTLDQVEKLKRTTSLMVQFYVNGTMKKQNQLEAIRDELDKANFDLTLVQALLKALEPFGDPLPEIKQPDPGNMSNSSSSGSSGDSCPVDHSGMEKEGASCPIDHSAVKEGYAVDGQPMEHLNKNPTVVRVRQHPKMLQYQKNLKEAEADILAQIERLQKGEKEFEALWLWSQNVVRAIKWVETYQDEYCNQKLGRSVPVSAKEDISEEDKVTFKKALHEIHFNLDESLDFFHASLDGRLAKYHEIEKAMLEAQIAVLDSFERISMRKLAILAELQQDQEYLASQMNVTPDTIGRRQRMTEMHTDFFDLLNWQRARLNAM
eukprot:TRINITY_DN12471_c0_g1_i1.p1 TRINITY_DN12471_c0_g1~~TRINITY_DN12471_c0_g1_i1.p1  ORF type:complete len:392 (-),score=114.22 TRINITY_DN12471_c0_g1_i1:19-1077(-)